MKISVTYEDFLYPLDISHDSELEVLKALLESESGLNSSDFAIYHNGNYMRESKKTLKNYGVRDGDILVMTKRLPRPHAREEVSSDWSSMTTMDMSRGSYSGEGAMTNIDPLVLREMLLSDSYQRSLLKDRNPPLSQALESGDAQKFVRAFNEQKRMRAEQIALRQRMIQADPLDVEAQQKIAEAIQQENINSNMETAMEFAPESFGQVTMLFINCFVNGHPVKAFVDSGAQATLMTAECAEKCNIMRLVDQRYAGLAKGVGTQKIIGRIHVTQIQIEDVFLASSFSVLESQPMDMLLGLDMLKRHQCCIDLKENKLKIGTTNTSTPFLPESELPSFAQLSSNLDQENENQNSLSASKAQSSGNQSRYGAEAFSRLPPNVSEADINGLLEMGFRREDILKELHKNEGDIGKTTAVLLARSLKFPSK